jgi:sugar phosphate isomerase/epimerase
MPKRISFQLYSARNFQPWEPVLKHLADCGYTEVEGFGGAYGTPGAFYDEPEKFRELLDKHGLSMPTGHFFPIDMFEKEKKRVLHIAKTLGMKYLYCPYILPEQRPKSGAGWKAWGKRLGEVGKAESSEMDQGLWRPHHLRARQGQCPQGREPGPAWPG